jgi:hypothetical protein
MDAAEYTLDQLGYKDHQYVVVAHDDKKHFHIHIMLNKVHQGVGAGSHSVLCPARPTEGALPSRCSGIRIT